MVSVLVVLSVVDSVDVCVVISVDSVVASVDVCVVISVVSVVASVVVAITKYTLPSYDYQKKTMMKKVYISYYCDNKYVNLYLGYTNFNS